MNILRRLPLSRLLLTCGLVLLAGVSVTALALGLGSGPTPPPKPLANALHDALASPPPAGVSARIKLTNHLLEGSELAGSTSDGEASQLASSPLLSGATGRLWIGDEGRARLELQSENGDTQIVYDPRTRTASLYDAATNTLYRYTAAADTNAAGAGTGAAGTSGALSSTGSASGAGASPTAHHEVPTVAKLQEAISHVEQHARLSGATPTDVAGHPAYTVRIAPSANGGLIGGAELSFDAVHGVPLRAAIYSSTSSAPVLELAATEISYGPVASSTLDFTPPSNATVKNVEPPEHRSKPSDHKGAGSDSEPKVTHHGQGLGGITVVEAPVKQGASTKASAQALPEGLPKVDVNGTSATELPTPLGTLLSFERSGVRYLLVGAVTPAAIEAFARGL